MNAPCDWLLLVYDSERPTEHYLGIAPGGRFFVRGVEVETGAEVRDGLMAFIADMGIAVGLDFATAIQNREIARLRAWLTEIGDQDTTETENCPWMAREALAGLPPLRGD